MAKSLKPYSDCLISKRRKDFMKRERRKNQMIIRKRESLKEWQTTACWNKIQILHCESVKIVWGRAVVSVTRIVEWDKKQHKIVACDDLWLDQWIIFDGDNCRMHKIWLEMRGKLKLRRTLMEVKKNYRFGTKTCG